MKFTHYCLKLTNGYTIVTPHGAKISDEEYEKYLSIVVSKLKETNADLDGILDSKVNTLDAEMLNEIFDALTPIRKAPRDILNLDGLAFIYVISYHIQKVKDEINPLLTHLMARALMMWLPDSKLIEKYLTISADNGQSLDAFVLAANYLKDDAQYGIKKNIVKALKYSEMLYQHAEKESDSKYATIYAKALYVNDKSNVVKAAQILLSAMENNRENPLVQLTSLLEILFERKLNIKVDFVAFEKMIFAEDNRLSIRHKALLNLAKCYISALNCNRDISKAIKYLKEVINEDADLLVPAGEALSNIYYKGIGVDIDYDEAYFISNAIQDEYLKHTTPNKMYFYDIEAKAHFKSEEAKYIKLLKRIDHYNVYTANVETIDHYLKIYLNDDQFEFLMNEYDENLKEEQREKMNEILKVFAHYHLIEKIRGACNKMIYVGTDNTGYDNFLNFIEAGNIFIHGTCGAGKTWYFYSLFKMMKEKECQNKLNIAFWSTKPFEFENWCNDYLVNDAHDFISKIKEFKEDKENQSVIFIDELMDFIYSISEEEKSLLLNCMEHSKEYNICFICNSQNMHTLMDEFGRYATTRICMMCSSNKEESIKMIGSNIATSIEQYGNMYVKNENIDQFKEPKLMTVKVWKQNNN